MKYQSELLGAIHETAVGLHKIGVISETEMREYDRDCLVRPSVPITEKRGTPHSRSHLNLKSSPDITVMPGIGYPPPNSPA
jgi:DNA-binding transcriptional regulator YiaG